MSVLVSEKTSTNFLKKLSNNNISDSEEISELDSLKSDEFIVELDTKKQENIILDSKLKKQQDVINMMSKVSNKIFDVIEFEGQEYYLDKDFKLIWNIDKQIVGLIKNNKYVFWSEINNLIEKVKLEDIKLKNIIKDILLNN